MGNHDSEFLNRLDRAPVLSREQVKQAYEQLHQRRAFRAVTGYYEWLLALLRTRADEPRTPVQLLDVGCGAGYMLEVARNAGMTVAGIDISETGVAQARTTVPDADLKTGPAEILPWPDRTFDYVTCVGSLEHFLDPRAAVREMGRVVKPEGRVLVVLPNRQFVFGIVHDIRRWFFADTGQPLERLARREDWQQLIQESGLQVLSVYKDNRFYLPGSVLRALSRVLVPLIPLRLAYQLVFVART